jgi:drug/metabolite transporter (DMT)-like permease
MNLAFFESICYSIAEHPVLTTLGLVLLIIFLWVTGNSTARWFAFVLLLAVICVLSFNYGLSFGSADQWNVLISVATLLAVLTALFGNMIPKLVYRERITVDVEKGVDLNGDYWVRGKSRIAVIARYSDAA